MSITNHLFISYAHIDNYHYTGAAKGWIDLLHERLEIRLAQLLGRKPTIWRDRKLAGNDDFNQTILIELDQTAILLAIITPRYIESSSCRMEIDNFFQFAAKNGGLLLADKHRVFKVVKTHVRLEDQPEEMRKLIGYSFYQPDESSGRFREFDYEISEKGERDKRYWEKFEDLAQDISMFIKRFESPNNPPAPSNGATVYLAETTSDLDEQRNSVRRELQQHGHIILPDKPLPFRAPDLQRTVCDYLERSCLSVHLIGEHFGMIPELETERSVVCLQQELAMALGNKAGFSRLIWLPPELAPKDPRQRKFVETLQNTFQSHNGSDLIQTKIEDLKTIIQAKLNPAKQAVPSVSADNGLTRIYLICDQRDLDDIQPLYTHLFDEGFEILLPSTEETAIQDNKNNLLDCDAVLFYYGAGNEMWLRSQISELSKAAGYGRTRPFLTKVIYVSGRETSQKKLLMTRDAIVIKNFGSFNPDLLSPLITQMNQAKGGSR